MPSKIGSSGHIPTEGVVGKAGSRRPFFTDCPITGFGDAVCGHTIADGRTGLVADGPAPCAGRPPCAQWWRSASVGCRGPRLAGAVIVLHGKDDFRARTQDPALLRLGGGVAGDLETAFARLSTPGDLGAHAEGSETGFPSSRPPAPWSLCLARASAAGSRPGIPELPRTSKSSGAWRIVLFALYSLVLKDLGPSAKTLRQVPVVHWNFPIPKYIPVPLLKALRLS